MSRNPLIDGLKVLASQLIVFHHFATYGPLSDVWDAAATLSSDWLFDYGKMAVQVFLVIAGFLAAKGLEEKSRTQVFEPVRLIGKRYLRLVLPFLAALAIAIPSAMLARHLATYQFFPAAPHWWQLLAHALLIHNMMGVESLSAGVWYVAIDFQLYILFMGLMYLCKRWARGAVLLLMVASLLYFNLDAGFDNWAIYFFGAYAMGCAAYWAANADRPYMQLSLLLLVGLAALFVEFRARIAIALCVALLLGHFSRLGYARGSDRSLGAPIQSSIQALSNSSYALFLVHFPFVMLGNALYAKLGLTSSASAAATILMCWALSMGLATLFERWFD